MIAVHGLTLYASGASTAPHITKEIHWCRGAIRGLASWHSDFSVSALYPTWAHAGGDTGAPYLTLRRLVVWLAEPRARLRALAELADGLAGAPGGQLVGKLHTAAQHGEPATRALVRTPHLLLSSAHLPCAC